MAIRELGKFGWYKNNPGENVRLLLGADARDIARTLRTITELNSHRDDVTSALFTVVKRNEQSVPDVRRTLDGFSGLFAALRQHDRIGPPLTGPALSTGFSVGYRSVIERTFIPAQLFAAAKEQNGHAYDRLEYLLELVRQQPAATDWRLAPPSTDTQTQKLYQESGYDYLGSVVVTTTLLEEPEPVYVTRMALAGGAGTSEPGNTDIFSLARLAAAVQRDRREVTIPVYGRLGDLPAAGS